MATGSMIEALQRAKRWGMGEPATYMPYRGEFALFRRMEAKGFVAWHEADLLKFTYAGYALTEAGQKALDSGSQSP